MPVDIKVINVPGSGADWNLAIAVNEDELPELNEDRRSIAKAYGIPERDYRRGVLAREIAEPGTEGMRSGLVSFWRKRLLLVVLIRPKWCMTCGRISFIVT
jgi:hypothetical protein